MKLLIKSYGPEEGLRKQTIEIPEDTDVIEIEAVLSAEKIDLNQTRTKMTVTSRFLGIKQKEEGSK